MSTQGRRVVVIKERGRGRADNSLDFTGNVKCRGEVRYFATGCPGQWLARFWVQPCAGTELELGGLPVARKCTSFPSGGPGRSGGGSSTHKPRVGSVRILADSHCPEHLISTQ